MSNPAWNSKTTDDEVAEHLKDRIVGKNVLVTGVTQGGLGAEFARSIAVHNPALIILAGRNEQKNNETEQILNKAFPTVKTRTLTLDLGSQSQVRKAAQEVNAYPENIDILVNNAGIMACPWGKTVDGIELQFGTNHIGHFLFTNLILDKILASGPGARIVNLTSSGHQFHGVRYDDWNFRDGEDYNEWFAYGQAKTANILFSISLVEKLGHKGMFSFSVHPGGIMTNLGRHISEEKIEELKKSVVHDLKTIEAGTATTVVAAFDPAIEKSNGSFLENCQVSSVAENAVSWATGSDNAQKLWELSEKLVGQKFDL